jgi:hypothetical protein
VTHLSAEQLGDIDGVADHEHLRTCRRCHDQWAQQRAVRDLLRALPDPGAIPPDVATGLAHALRDLTPNVAPAASGAGSTVVPLRSDSGPRGGRSRPWLAAAAAVIVLGGGGAALVTHPWSGVGAGDATSADTSAGASQGSRESGSRAVASAAAQVRSTGTDYDRAGLAAQVRRELLAAPAWGDSSAAPGVVGDGSGASGDTRLASPQGLASCLSALGVDAGQVTTVDLARFEGDPAALVVVAAPGGAHDVWVVGRGCRQGDDQTTYFVRLP